ncbi:PIN domain-containing protein [Neorhizobium lilium]|uniref:Ribonuclease VapC n=1 Tax=Neorhizobium lilium TaxID=2503024 RepID=A0A3S3RIM6_9HYPH|nr:PIN domain-containing protein [Neorhizobium lilium]RWX79000.1 PIN domain-containing protein [Neorhizobium lilium]
MIGIDTNVLLRFLVEDEPAQSAVAHQFMLERSAEDPAYISAVVLAETVWFLSRRLDYPKTRIFEVLGVLAQSAEIVVEHSAELKHLVAATRQPAADIADYLVAWSALKSGCSKTFTFDQKAATRVPGMELLA